MSGIFGAYERNGHPADRQLWHRLGNLTAHRGPDGTKIWSHGPILLGHNALHTTVESLQEELPRSCTISGLAITADARIDNRDELSNALGLERYRIQSDSSIILAAYERWGKACLSRLLGDFSFVIWDSGRNQMFCARDHLGVKPFHYFLSDRQFAFSSEVRTLVIHPAVSSAPNEGMIGEYLAAKFISKTETLFRDILRLAPAHSMTITPETVLIQQYWKPDFHHRLRYRNENNYIDHFHEIFSEAVTCRLRSHLPVSFELSGGLDSSSIIGMAYSVASAEQRGRFLVHSLIYPGLACDERKYIESVEKHLGIQVRYIDASHLSIPDWQQQIRETFTLPDAPNLSNSIPLLENVRQNNSRVLLSGIGGDEWFTGSKHIYLDLLLDKDIAGMMRNFAWFFRENSQKACKELAASLLWPFLPCSVRTMIMRWRKRPSLYPPWISRAFIEKANLVERLFAGISEPYVANLAKADCFSLFHTGYESMVLENNSEQKARYQIEMRHPFLDRRLVDFALSLPNSLHLLNGDSKHLLRLTGKDYLPALVRKRYSKAEFSQLYSQAFNSQSFIYGLLNSMLYKKGWIDEQTLQETYENNVRCFQKKPAGPCGSTQQIWFVFAISAWYANVTALREMKEAEIFFYENFGKRISHHG